MASSNRHWPSMFKSKPCNTHHQWQHDINPSLMSTPCQRTPYAPVPGCEERSPEPKPRWNPKPEQIRILEAIFNSGMVNPPRDEIRKIRAQLQEYGQVGDANVFYWFQNRKSRSKHKQRHLQSAKSQAQTAPVTTSPAPAPAVAVQASSSSSSSEKSPPRRTDKPLPAGGDNVIEASNSPTTSVNQTYFQPQLHVDFNPEPFFFPVQSPSFSQGFCFSELSNVVQIPDQLTNPCPDSLLLNDLINQGAPKKDDQVKMKLNQQLSSYTTITTAPVTTTTTGYTTALNQIQGVGESGGNGMIPAAAVKSTVFINDVAFEVAVGPLNVREAFGDDAILVNSSGQPVLTNEWGVTLQSLQHGAFYYLWRTV
ncbi:PREDICTED: WUSCHEL-related homeobox 9-like [Nelumbo nucifera]|uniref:WUSCHEL-related homeobox 9-like n=2 Tax=Nelumbo nucifera TaxID=4432 RepID=A0A1U8A2D8_NELNU|nr:PREDICTED: WUSCHEL-related homeobox 9-like [Nelumbo nucifera]DAD22745.1 TPA_asm: hypothetical protein HUJ06_024208 [Nelumbo nucifera]